ncbi:hypothetical protein BDF19DRAFT_414199 [Syncephalis fuscata]|nr:hypothetical protein BDF19DRAFT_414199 [Syncephalis fuscata]
MTDRRVPHYGQHEEEPAWTPTSQPAMSTVSSNHTSLPASPQVYPSHPYHGVSPPSSIGQQQQQQHSYQYPMGFGPQSNYGGSNNSVVNSPTISATSPSHPQINTANLPTYGPLQMPSSAFLTPGTPSAGIPSSTIDHYHNTNWSMPSIPVAVSTVGMSPTHDNYYSHSTAASETSLSMPHSPNHSYYPSLPPIEAMPSTSPSHNTAVEQHNSSTGLSSPVPTMGHLPNVAVSPTHVASSPPPQQDFETFAHFFKRKAQPLPLPHLDAYLAQMKGRVPEFPILDELPPAPPPPPKPNNGQDSNNDNNGREEEEDLENDINKELFPPFSYIPKGVTVEELKRKGAQGTNPFQSAIMGTIAENSQRLVQVTATFLRLEIVRDFIQFIGLYLTILVPDLGDQFAVAFRNFMNFISLRFSNIFRKGAIFLIIFSVISVIALAIFNVLRQKDPNANRQGLEVNTWAKRRAKIRRRNMIILFIVTTLYLPLLSMALGALTWSDDFWPIKNPYKNTDNPDFAAMPHDEGYRSPEKFCYNTSMKEGEFNWAYLIVPLAAIIFVVLGAYFPYALFRLIRWNQPKIDRYDDDGQLIQNYREEYQRKLEQDMSPYNFLYSGYDESWSWYKVFIMGAKLLAVMIAVIVSKDNCLFHTKPRVHVELSRQILLIVLNLLLLAAHLRTQAFLLPSQNYSETTSRIAQTITGVIGVFVVLNIGNQKVSNVLLVIVAVVATVIVVYFVLQNLDIFKRFVRKVTHEVELDPLLLAPDLNTDKQILNRVWQESWSALFLVMKQFRLPLGKPLAYYESRNISPYLLDFQGTVAERHLENLKIARHIGLRHFQQELEQPNKRVFELRNLITKEFSGTDMYYRPNFTSKLQSFFGKALILPFPFCVVITYDEDPDITVQLTTEEELEEYVTVNQKPEIAEARENRIQLRALDGSIVSVPSSFLNLMTKKNLHGKLTIARMSTALWGPHDVGPGFKVTITIQSSNEHEHKKTKDFDMLNRHTTAASIVGLGTDKRILGHADLNIKHDFSLTNQLREFFEANHTAILISLPEVKRNLQAYRDYYLNMAKSKDGTLSYAFFTDVYCNSELNQDRLKELLAKEGHPLVGTIPIDHTDMVQCLYARLRNVYQSNVHMWWYVFWDDLYRRNYLVIQQFRKRVVDFSPYSPKSICYQPMPRAELEKFIAGNERGGYRHGKGIANFLHAGILNRLYARLDTIIMSDAQPEASYNAATSHNDSDNKSEFVTRSSRANAATAPMSMPRSESYLKAAIMTTADVKLARPPTIKADGNENSDIMDLRFPEPSHDGNMYW